MSPRSKKKREEKRLRKKRNREEKSWRKEKLCNTMCPPPPPPPENLGWQGDAARDTDFDNRSRRAPEFARECMDLRDQLIAKNAELENWLRRMTHVFENSKYSLYKAFEDGELNSAESADWKIIGEGNEWEWGGDAVFDAYMYEGKDRRTDPEVFQLLYEFPPETVRRIRHKETIDVLNVHAGVISSKSKVGSAKFYKLFAEFAELFEKSGGYDESYLDSEPTEVTHAYRAFRKCIKDEVTKVGGAERL